MTYGVFSIVANEISPSGCASYTYDLAGSHPYVRAPWYQYSEQLIDDGAINGEVHPAFPSLTGMVGSYRVTLFGYLGLRLLLDTLNVDPALPPQVPHINYRTFYWQGHALDAISNQTHTTLTRLLKALSRANTTFFTAPIPVTFGIDAVGDKTVSKSRNRVNNSATSTDDTKHFLLPPNGTLTLPNRRPYLNKTAPNNIAQCRPVISNTEHIPGQFPLAAVDGARSTKWQPVSAITNSTIVVSLPEPFVPVVRFEFDWAASPPQKFYIHLSNVTGDVGLLATGSGNASLFAHVASETDVSVSRPRNSTAERVDPDAWRVVRPYESNTTSVVLGQPVWSGKWTFLTV
ncbi:hypothetical protein LTS18_011493 [Coniosporium uncinatum]|uniref:Uncharacterized protein n=1 Tax=Coniosporium uncinatum TaxID=93489 RepID=A0ACC3DJT7_9PEZI|nr:hypothetical protein LTS18_011493 [Coniosporium uncinatum]